MNNINYFKFSKILVSVFTKCIHIYGMYLWNIEGNIYAENIMTFIIWLYFIISFALIPDSSLKAVVEHGGLSIPSWLTSLFDIIIIGFLVYFGHFFLGSIYSIGSIIQYIFSRKVEKFEY